MVMSFLLWMLRPGGLLTKNDIIIYPTYCRYVAAFLQQKLAVRKLVL